MIDTLGTMLSGVYHSCIEILSFPRFLPTLFLTIIVMPKLVEYFVIQFCTDIPSMPSPPLPIWKKYTIGHNLLALISSETAISTAARYNKWRETHGPIFVLYGFFGKPLVVAMSESSIRTINVTKYAIYHKNKLVRKTMASLIGHNGIILAEGDKHATLRAAIAPSLHHNALLALSSVFFRDGARVADHLGSLGPHVAPDVLQIVRKGTFNVILETSFGSGTVDVDKAQELQDAFLKAFLEPRKHLLRRLVLQTVLWFLPARWFGFREDLRAHIRKTVSQLCENRSVTGGEGKPLLQLMEENARRPVARNDLIDTVLSFLSAGQVTTSMAVCWVLHELACAPEWQRRVVEELREKWTEDDGLDALDRLPVLSRVVHECLRLYPPVFFEPRDLAQNDELDGYRLPKGTMVRVPILALQRNRSIWGEDAEQFNPDRHLDGMDSQKRMFWMPFLHGPRNCVGSRFAVLEIKAFVAQVLLKHKVSVQAEKDGLPEMWGAFATPHKLKLYFSGRKGE